MKTLFSDAEGILQFINAMEAAQQKSKQKKLVIHEEYMHTVGLELLLQSDETKRKHGSGQNSRCKTTHRSRPKEEEKTFGGSAIFGSAPKKSKEQLQRREQQGIEGPALLKKSNNELSGRIFIQYANGCKCRAARGGIC